MSQVYTEAEIANILNISQKTIQRHRQAGRLQGHKENGRWVFNQDSVDRYIKESNKAARPAEIVCSHCFTIQGAEIVNCKTCGHDLYPEPGAQAVGDGSSVLVVDDTEEVAELLADHFNRAGFNAKYADGGNAALEMFTENPFQIVVTDIRMPTFGGVALAKALRDHVSRPIIIGISGFTDISQENLFNTGLSAIFHKPFTSNAIVAAVSHFVKLKKAS